MNILDLEEAADLTPDLVRAYLERKGWKLKTLSGKAQTWTDPKGKESFVMKDGWEWWLDGMVDAAVDFESRTPQQVLREMNPRMRAGMPTQRARYAHARDVGGLWLARVPFDRVTAVVCLTVSLDPEIDDELIVWSADRPQHIEGSFADWSFWTCDEHGNKVPWPRDASGKEL